MLRQAPALPGIFVRPPTDMHDILPRRLASGSAIHFVHLSSPAGPRDRRRQAAAFAYLRSAAGRAATFDVVRDAADPWYLSASPETRVSRFREALRDGDWLCPVHGGTGCGDAVRRLTDADLRTVASRRPIVTGSDDATFLVNHLYFTTGLRTFHAPNGAGFARDGAAKTLLAVLRGGRERLAYFEDGSSWMGSAPDETLEGIAVGGNLTAFHHLLDVTDAGPDDWSPYVLFLEERASRPEDLHRMLVSLDARGVFDAVRGLVIGNFGEPWQARAARLWNAASGAWKQRPSDLVPYVLRETLAARERRGDPLSILRLDRFGSGARAGSMIVPVGARAVLNPDRTVEFNGPFVS